MNGRKGTVEVIGVPLDLGASRRGVDMGPSAIRIADLESRLVSLGYEVTDLGNLEVAIPETQEVAEGEEVLRYKSPIVETCRDLMKTVQASLDRGAFPLVLGGDHSIALGSIAGASLHHAARKGRIGLIWFDAHGDFNTPETTQSGNIHGMPLAATLGMGDHDLVNLGGTSPKVDPRNAVLIGVRDLDPREKENIRSSGISTFTMREVDESGMRSVMNEAIKIASDGTNGIYVSFDLDVIDPEFAPGTGTPVVGGLSYREAHLAMEIMSDRADLVALDLVEVNPVIDNQNHTALLAVELVQSLLGKEIL